MGSAKRAGGAILLAGLWIGAMEFLRNELVLGASWREHYEGMGLTFPAEPVNAAVWVAWGFVFAFVVFVLTRKFTVVQATLVGWTAAFLMMWLVAWNLAVLPVTILAWAVPWSLLESFGAAFLCRKVAP